LCNPRRPKILLTRSRSIARKLIDGSRREDVGALLNVKGLAPLGLGVEYADNINRRRKILFSMGLAPYN
jgi:hypothetical protein